MNGDIDAILRQAEHAAKKGQAYNELRASIHALVHGWPNEGLVLLAQAMREARKQLPDEMVRDWERGRE